jgi:hypothetical protein
MHGELRLKIVNAKQAELVHRYKNIKTKLLKSNAAIFVQQGLQVWHLFSDLCICWCIFGNITHVFIVTWTFCYKNHEHYSYVLIQ